MITLTEQQLRVLQTPHDGPPRILDPRTNVPYVLLKEDEYQRLKESESVTAWTDEEMDLLAIEAGDLLDNYQPIS